MMSLAREALQVRAKVMRGPLKQSQTKEMRGPLDGRNLARKQC